jgi:hypothetical protein
MYCKAGWASSGSGDKRLEYKIAVVTGECSAHLSGLACRSEQGLLNWFTEKDQWDAYFLLPSGNLKVCAQW